tara:strand:+ start:60 stop:695 length:636 start_codon:yes stop_codon:yes gene_type:complete
MPKCASTSIERAISTLCNINFSGRARIKHINAQIFTEKILSAHQALLPSIQIESFCVMREPLQWIESWYKYRSREKFKKEHNRNYTGHISYNDFITEYISKGTRKPFAKIRTQYDFLKLRNGEIGIDLIFPLENMGLVEQFLFEKTNSKIIIPRINQSPTKDMTQLPPELEDALRQHLAKDIVVYNFIKKHKTFQNSQHGEEFMERLAELD